MCKDKRFLKTIKSYKELNISSIIKHNIGIEIQDFTNPNLSEEEIKNIINFYKNELNNFKGIKSMHGPFIDLKPVSPDKLIRKTSISRYSRAMEIAMELDMDYIIFHSQINPNHIGENVEENINKANNIFWKNFIKKYDEYKGVILIENVFEKDPISIKNLIKTIDQHNIKINLDIGHAKLSSLNLETWIKELKNHIGYIHVHSNDGKFDLHESPNYEEINSLYNVLEKYRINPILSLEYEFNNINKEMEKYL